MSDELKSAWEVALEKLQAEGGDVPKLTNDQKERIAEIRGKYQAHIAAKELEIQASIRKAVQAGELDQVQALQKQLVEERQTLRSKMEEEVEAVRRGPSES